MRFGQGKLLQWIGFILLAACCFPYVITLGWTGSINGQRRVLEGIGGEEGISFTKPGERTLSSGKQVILDRETTTYLDVEQYLVGAVARQIPADYEMEALKAQAVIARTYIYQQMGGSSQIAESALDMDYLEQVQMEKLWGTRNYLEFYNRVEQAVAETSGIAIKYEGEYIDALFCRCSAGKTRKGDKPYLAGADCPEDMQADGYLQLKEWTPEEFSRLISSIPDGGPVSADQVPDTIQIGERDENGYVTVVQIGNVQFGGDEVRYALSINSSCFRLENYHGNIRAEVKGIGHGYGFSQFCANQKAKDGWSFEELLNYFYQNILLVSE